MFHASWPMASTSWVLVFKAMTVGSFITMPRPRAATRVFAVPRSMARSLARPRPPMPSSPAGPHTLGGQRTQTTGELLDARLHRCRPAPTERHDEGDEQHDYQWHTYIQQIRHFTTAPQFCLDIRPARRLRQRRTRRSPNRHLLTRSRASRLEPLP